MNKEEITEKIEAFEGNIFEADNWIKEQFEKYPERPSKPSKPISGDSIAYKKYAIELEEYESKYPVYKAEVEKRQNIRNEYYYILESHMKKYSGLTKLPEKTQQKIWSKAWEDGHSNGYYQVYYNLKDLIALFED